MTDPHHASLMKRARARLPRRSIEKLILVRRRRGSLDPGISQARMRWPEVDPFEGGRQIAQLGSGDCYDFLNEIDVVDEMGGFWPLVGEPEQRRAAGLPPKDNAAERAEEIRRAARELIDQFGPFTPE